MKRYILAALAVVLLFAAPVSAGSITFTVDSPLGTWERVYNVPNAHLTRLIAAVRTNHGQVIDVPRVEEVRDPETNEVTSPMVPATYRDMTNSEALAKLFRGTVMDMRKLVRDMETNTARAEALAGVSVPLFTLE